jgi:hypothetical protein
MVAGGTVLLTSLGLSTIPDRSSGVELTGDFSVPDESVQITEPVNNVKMAVDGSVKWDSDTAPTNVIIRVEISRSGIYEQLEATKITSDLTRSDSRDFDFSVNVLDHSQIQAVELSPTQTGETKSLNLSGRIVVELNVDGETLATEEYEDSFSLEATKSLGQVTLEFGATGDVTIS